MHIKFNSIRMHDDSNELLLAEGVYNVCHYT